jgi:hypothetical protein
MIISGLFFDHYIVALITTDPDVIFATINPDFIAFAVSELLVGIPKNLIFAMSTLVVNFLFSFSCNSL